MIKKTILALCLALGLFGSSYAVPLWVDTPNNTVNLPGTMISEQIHRDYAQLSLTPDIVQLVSNSVTLWTTNILNASASGSVLIDSIPLNNGYILAIDELSPERLYLSRDGGQTYPYTTINWITANSYPSFQQDAAGNVYWCYRTNGNYTGVRKSTDFGSTWTSIFSSTNTGAEYPSFSVSERGDIAVLSGRSTPEQTNKYIVVSHDGGSSWSYIYPSWQAKEYTIGKPNKAIAYCGNGVFVGAAGYKDSTGFEVFRSTDYGTTWSCSYTNTTDIGERGPMWISASMNGDVAFRTRGTSVVHVSHDYGSTWKKSISTSVLAGSALNLYKTHWLFGSWTDASLLYTPDDFSTYSTVLPSMSSSAYPSRTGPIMNKNCIVWDNRFSSDSAYVLFALQKNSTKLTRQTPTAIPVISGSPVAFPGSVYSDGTNFYRSTNGTTWVIF